jgi:hypothetical protein
VTLWAAAFLWLEDLRLAFLDDPDGQCLLHFFLGSPAPSAVVWSIDYSGWLAVPQSLPQIGNIFLRERNISPETCLCVRLLLVTFLFFGRGLIMKPRLA